MGCDSCSTGKPTGCKSNGGCSTGGCNRMNVHDWLANLPFSDPESNCRIIEVSFNQGSRKDFYRNNSLNFFEKGDIITVEGVNGFDVGTVSITGELVRLQLKKKGVKEDSSEIKRILRIATESDISKWKESKSREKEVLIRPEGFNISATDNNGIKGTIRKISFRGSFYEVTLLVEDLVIVGSTGKNEWEIGGEVFINIAK